MRLEKDRKIETIEREGTLLHKCLADGGKRRKLKKIAAEKVLLPKKSERMKVFLRSLEKTNFSLSLFFLIIL
jgi:hypothetical protein